jgi:benzodiazapine receptor
MLESKKLNASKPYFVRSLTITLLVLVLGFLSGISTANEIKNWYVDIIKPSFNPPNFIFGPVWTLLYILMGVSFSIVISQKPSVIRTKSIAFFCIQFILNLGWSFIFFKMHEVGWALAEIIALWISILVMIFWFYRINKTAALLQIPYLLWVSFATILNASIFYLN